MTLNDLRSFGALTAAELAADASLDRESSGWEVLTMSSRNHEEHKTTGELLLDIYDYVEVWLNQNHELVVVERRRTTWFRTDGSMSTTWEAGTPRPLSDHDVAGLGEGGSTGQAAVRNALSALPPNARAQPMNPSGRDSPTRTPAPGQRRLGDGRWVALAVLAVLVGGYLVLAGGGYLWIAGLILVLGGVAILGLAMLRRRRRR